MAGFIENMFYKPQGTIYHKFIHSAADCCFNVEYWISVHISVQAKKGGESKAVQASLHFIMLILDFLHSKSIVNAYFSICKKQLLCDLCIVYLKKTNLVALLCYINII